MRPLRGLPAEVRALAGVAFMVALGFGLVAPALPLFAREFGVNKTLAGAVVSAFALMRLLMAPFVGRLVNAFGERVLLATGIGVVAVSSALAGLAQTYWQLLVLRGIGGVGSIMFSVSAASLLVRVTPDHLRGRAQGVWAGAFLIGMIAGPAVGTVATFSLRAPFFLYAGTLVIAGVLGLGSLRHSELAARSSVREAPITLATALRNRAYLAALAASFAGDFSLVGARAAIVPQFVTDRLHLGAGWAYAAFLVVSLVSGALLLPLGRIADTRGRRPVIVVGLFVGAAGFVLLPTLPFAVGLIAATVLLGVAGAADSVAPGAVMGDVVAGRGGTVVAVFQMSGDLGAVLGPVVTGWIADGAGYGAAFAVSAAVCALPILVVAAAPETLRRAPAGSAVPIASDAS
ncbi:MAG: transporter, family, multidrug resistance protein [Pseudonocardiales bacterium]|nr:transporter, family, multidrug resistance protein [Pseudonocardiales bacterium]MDT4949099.1 transporter, family, multidrug resistance protein [Pseudonocardiales bacterium]